MVELETQTLPLTRAAMRAEGAQGKTFTFDAFTRVKESAYINPLPWKHYWLLYPFYSLNAGNVGRKVKKQREDAAHKSKNHKNKCLMGPFKSLEAPGKYPLSPPPPSQWACHWLIPAECTHQLASHWAKSHLDTPIYTTLCLSPSLSTPFKQMAFLLVQVCALAASPSMCL